MQNEPLSKYFTLHELTFSDTAIRKGIDNTPPAEVVEVLRDTARGLDEVRVLLGQPVHVLSGYRSLKLNSAVGGVKTSGHLSGHAADFVCPGFGTVAEVFAAIKASRICFDQLIVERPGSINGGWVHISFDGRARRQCLSFDGKGYSIA